MRSHSRRNGRGSIEYFLPFYYLLSQYKIGPIPLGTIGLLIIAVYTLFKRSGVVRLPSYYNGFIYFFLYVIIRDGVKIISGVEPPQTQINKIIEYSVVFFLILIICNKSFDENRLYSTWKIAGFIYITGLVYHIIMIYILGRNIFPISIIPGYSLAIEGIESDRACSFFSEPAAFVTAMIPLEFLALKRSDFKWAMITTVAILASTSTVGIVLSVVLWALFLFSRAEKKKYRVTIIIVAIALTVGFFSLDIFSSAVEKARGVISGGGTLGSRVIMGYEIVSTQTLLSLIFGSNYNDAFNYVGEHLSVFSSKMTYVYWSGGYVYLNTFFHIIFSYGIVGLLLFYNPWIKMLRTNEYQAKPYIITMLIATLGQSLLLNSYYFMIVIILLSYCDSKSILPSDMQKIIGDC